MCDYYTTLLCGLFIRTQGWVHYHNGTEFRLNVFPCSVGRCALRCVSPPLLTTRSCFTWYGFAGGRVGSPPPTGVSPECRVVSPPGTGRTFPFWAPWVGYSPSYLTFFFWTG